MHLRRRCLYFRRRIQTKFPAIASDPQKGLNVIPVSGSLENYWRSQNSTLYAVLRSMRTMPMSALRTTALMLVPSVFIIHAISKTQCYNDSNRSLFHYVFSNWRRRFVCDQQKQDPATHHLRLSSLQNDDDWKQH
jgi:hypothetical protein